MVVQFCEVVESRSADNVHLCAASAPSPRARVGCLWILWFSPASRSCAHEVHGASVGPQSECM